MKRKAPGHLEPSTRRWFESVLADYDVEPHHVRLLQLACEAWDRGQAARRALAAAKEMVYSDRFGSVRPRPEIAIERDARLAFARLLRELALDVEVPAESRPPLIGGRREKR